ncbi:TonB-dependent receptor [Shewanella frigidimarina]|uniref:TonB-dependent receptor n=1 Tax=Shewanella frigidimarina TaxID=56812 RepID=A0A106BZ48_SHEFR|nr:TonB-dependent receptor [Shewanella frigidimarina]KVX01281.1 TonB-dependent receptor [Shewanella frigidimarina]
MPINHAKFKHSAVYLALAAAVSLNIVSVNIYAEEANESDKKTSQAEEIEVITVTGMKGSLQKSINDKRFSENLTDSINAEDIGKSTDQNIADALSRVTGVSVQSVDGQGSRITVRGANSQQNNISLNGVQLSTADFSQSVDLSQYSSDILSKIEVVKTPSADHEEGALGANINLITTKPLDLDYKIRTLTAEGRYNDLLDDDNYKLSTTLSEKFFDDEFGVIFTAVTETNSYRKDQYAADNWVAEHSSNATDTEGNVVNDVWGITNKNSRYELYNNEDKKINFNLGLQWAASESTEFNFNTNYTKQDFDSEMHGVQIRSGQQTNMVEGVDPGLGGGPSAWTDPQQNWHTIDLKTNTFTKYLNRFGDGGLIQSQNKFSEESSVISFDMTHHFTDEFSMETGIGYSKSELTPDNQVFIALQNYGNINRWLIKNVPATDIEPVGYDCTSGNCTLVGGSGLINYGANNTFGDPLNVWDNYSTTGFNVDELDAQHLTFLNRSITSVEDEQKSAFVDFDWIVDAGAVRSIEFGAKYSTRDKYVDAQVNGFNSVSEGVVVLNPYTNQPVVLNDGLNSLTGDLFATDSSFPVNDFMSSLGYGRDAITDGWSTFSAFKAFDLALGSPTVGFTPDNSNTRSAELENFASYLKANFDLFDGRLSGDVGVRYVQTKVDVTGSSGVQFAFDPGNVGRLMDPFKLAELRDTSLPLCGGIPFYGANWNSEARWGRVDGEGYDTLGTATFTDDVNIADQGPCHDPNTLRGNPNESDWWLWRHSDVSTEKYYVYGDRQFDANGNLVATEDRSKRSFGAIGTHDYDVFLPSLNLNYALNDDTVLRFAASKTMARPQIDSLRPGFKVNETQWGGYNRNNTITLTSPKLDPLESINLDLSYEWYFNQTGLLAAGLFYKDMTNFEESETIVTYMDDLRGIGLTPGETYDPENLLLIAGQDDLAKCMPKRFQGSDEFREDWMYSGDLEQMCAQFKTTRIKNGKGAKIKGLELQYMQTFDMLPGWMSGLGIQTNYTYQDSEYDQEVSSINSNITLPSLQVAYTPEHSYNLTTFWEKDGHQLRLSYRGNSDQLAQRSWESGSLWEEGRKTLDFSASYKLNDFVTFSFQAVNLTDEGVRQYFTSRFINIDGVALDEGSPISGDATNSRTVTEYKTGRTFRLNARVNF